ncbi:MAG: HD-GYP domain-containing protein [Candidatus Marinimicrobia bacterium]|nr:HD-GYP domain-containing protein [Candidatus Neomarinimicrobiota bacterium]
MHIESLDKIESGAKLGKTLYSGDGRVLLGRGVELTNKYINRLKEFGYYSIFISDDFDDEVDVRDIIQESTRTFAISQVKSLFKSSMEGNGQARYIGLKNGIGNITNSIIDDITGNDNLMIDLYSLKTHDDYTFQHSVNVSVLALVLGVKAGLNGMELRELAKAAILHDIGKMHIPFEILSKDSSLTDEEFELVKSHTNEGFSFLLNDANVSPKIAIVAYQHHERFDGLGYPEGIAGERMHLYSKIVSLIDTYDALTSDRVYRKRFNNDTALKIIFKESEGKFEPKILSLLKNCVVNYPTGSLVKLNTGETGIILRNNSEILNRPVIKLLADKDGNKIENSEEIDTSQDGIADNIEIVSII